MEKKKSKVNKGLIQSINDAPQITYDPSNFTFESFCKTIADIDNQERERRIRWNEENKEPPPLTELEISIHKKSDALLGNYPMTKERLLALIELLPNGLVNIDYYGMMFPVKGQQRMWIQAMGDEMTHEQLYMNYLEIKKYIPHGT